MAEEKRRFLRVPIETEIFCEGKPRQGERGKGTITIYSSNISVGGLFIESSIPFAICSTIYLRFRLPGADKDILVEGQVARYHTEANNTFDGMGIEFTRLSFHDKQLIENYINNHREPISPAEDK